MSPRTQEGTAPGPGLAWSWDASGAPGLQAALGGLIWGSGEQLAGSRLCLPAPALLGMTLGGVSDREGTCEKVT